MDVQFRKVTFEIDGVKLPLIYSNEYLFSNSRFEIIEYTPSNLLLRMAKKIINYSK